MKKHTNSYQSSRSESGNSTTSITSLHSDSRPTPLRESSFLHQDPFSTPDSTRPSSPSLAAEFGFATPIRPKSRVSAAFGSRAGSTFGARSGFQYAEVPGTGYFRSRRIRKGTTPLPKKKKAKRESLLWILPTIGLGVGLLLSILAIYLQLASVSKTQYCSVLEDDFASGLDTKIWTREVEVGGYGNQQFEETTNDPANSFVKDGQLYIKPTLQDEKLIESNNVINRLADGTCTSTVWSSCVTSTNTTNGTIVPPVRSARLNTKGSASIKYGKVEVVAKLPKGDWLWPAIWMLPVKETYGAWPASGEIDIAESRGNNYTYSLGGNNFVTSTLHWGPDAANDAYKKSQNERTSQHSEFGDQFHTFGLIWDPKYLYTYLDKILIQVMYFPFNKPLWGQGGFSYSNSNGTQQQDIWSSTGRTSTPFDQEFYLILNVAVGGQNGYFLDGADGKPWVDASPYSKNDFWKARKQWLPTWEKNGQMIVDSVKMWKTC